jgi:hypothetical protein
MKRGFLGRLRTVATEVFPRLYRAIELCWKRLNPAVIENAKTILKLFTIVAPRCGEGPRQESSDRRIEKWKMLLDVGTDGKEVDQKVSKADLLMGK